MRYKIMDTVNHQTEEFLDAVLARLRQSLRYSKIKLELASENAGYNKQYASRVLTKKISPSLEAILLLCIANGIPPEKIFLDSKNYERLISYKSACQVLPDQADELREKLALTLRKRETTR